jgi:acyl carrier protein
MNLQFKIIKIIAEALEVEENLITEDTSIGDIPEWNSLGHVMIISSLEKEFTISFEPEMIMDIEDVSDIIAAIEDRLKNN